MAASAAAVPIRRQVDNTIQRITGVPSRGAVLMGDQPSLRIVLAMVRWISEMTAAFGCRLRI